MKPLVAAVASIVVLAGCSSSGSSPATAKPGPTHSTVAPSPVPAAPSGTKWLCRPGARVDPCATPVSTTSIAASGARTVQRVTDRRPAVDCFYVYPTVSAEMSVNADLKLQREETEVAFAQASPFSRACRVWAPLYRQVTVSGLTKAIVSDHQALDIAYAGVLSAWRDYLAHDNDGRRVVFIGHSQGAAMLIRLLRTQIDPNPALRARMALAILAGGNVAVPTGKTVGATFRHLPLCASAQVTRCVVAYSTYPRQPPAFSLFGRPGRGVSLMSGQTASAGLQVACVNPAGYGAHTRSFTPLYPSATVVVPGGPITTTWSTFPDLYRGGCRSADGATWLQVSTHDKGVRPAVSETLGPLWGYHRDDVNLVLGNLVHDVAAASASR